MERKLSKDVLFAALRVSTLIGAVGWMKIRAQFYDETAIYLALGIFAFYSIVLYSFVVIFPHKTSLLYRLFLIPDLIFIGLLIKYTGSVNSEFFAAYYLLIALHTYYYQSMRVGLLTALLSTIFYLAFNRSGLGIIPWADLLIRLVFVFLVALSTGFLTQELTTAYKRLSESISREKKINKSLDNKLAQITLLHQISQEMSQAESQDAVNKLAVWAAGDLLDAPKVYLMRVEGHLLKFAAGMGVDAQLFDGTKIHIDEGIVGSVFLQGTPQIVSDIQARPDSVFSEIDSAENLRAVVAAPIRAENRILGVLNASRPEADSFTSEDLNLLGVLAAMVGAALIRTEKYESTQRLAITDSKTEVYNYHYFKSMLEEYVTAKPFKKLSLLMLDVDYFKLVNDTHGHQVGDEVLRAVAGIVAATVRSNDVVARFGGEEFVAFLPECGLEEALNVGERIRISLEKYPIQTTVGPIPVTVSIGVAEGNECANADYFIHRVDKALYMAKGSGRNRVCCA